MLNNQSERGDSRLNDTGNQAFYVQLLLLGVLCVSLCANVLLGWKYKSLSQSLPEPHVGMTLATLKVTTLSGQHLRLTLDDQQRPTILYVFRPYCKWCKANLIGIRSFVQQRSFQLRFIGISTSSQGLESELTENPLPFPIFIVSDPSELAKMTVVGTPQTIEISKNGSVSENWVGVYRDATEAAINKKFNFQLPHIELKVMHENTKQGGNQ